MVRGSQAYHNRITVCQQNTNEQLFSWSVVWLLAVVEGALHNCTCRWGTFKFDIRAYLPGYMIWIYDTDKTEPWLYAAYMGRITDQFTNSQYGGEGVLPVVKCSQSVKCMWEREHDSMTLILTCIIQTHLTTAFLSAACNRRKWDMSPGLKHFRKSWLEG